MEEVTWGQALIFGGLCGCGYLLYRVYGQLKSVNEAVTNLGIEIWYEIKRRRENGQ